MIKLKDLLAEAPQIKKVKNVSVQYLDAEFQGETLHGFKYFKKGPWLYKKNNGEYFAVVITNKNNRYEIQLGNKPKNNIQATAAVEKVIKKNLNKFESINEAPGKSGKDQYVGTARVKVEPYTYKNQKRDFHDVSMYRDHKKPYHYYLSIRLAHSNKVDMVISTGTHILKKAGKWAQGFIKRRVGGTGKERFG